MEMDAKSGKGRSDTPESRTSSLALQTHPKYYNSNYKAHPSTKLSRLQLAQHRLQRLKVKFE